MFLLLLVYIFSMINQKYDISHFQKLAEEKGGKCLSSEYINLTSQIEFECKNGHKWKVTPRSILNSKNWCKKCGDVQKYDLSFFQNFAKEKEGKCLSTEYLDYNKKLKFECKNGHVWETAPNSITNSGTWCKKCYNIKKYDISHFQKIASDKGGKCLSIEYINCNTPLKFECSRGHIWETTSSLIIENHWCPQCRHRKYEVDNSFFSRDTEESFYIAGFWAADGWKRVKAKNHMIGVGLCLKDIDHLKNIRDKLKCTTPIKYSERFVDEICGTKINRICYSCGFWFCSEQCFNDLERFGVIANKTSAMHIEPWLKEHPMLNHFLRGFFDGDGCFYETLTHNSSKTIGFSITGTKVMLQDIHDSLVLNNACNDVEDKKIKEYSGKNKDIYGTLSYGGNAQISKMYDWLYKDATIFLPRKEEVARRVKAFLEGSLLVNKLNITKEDLLNKLKEYKSIRHVSIMYGCSNTAIYSAMKMFEIEEEYNNYVEETSVPDGVVFEQYKELGNGAEVGRRLGLAHTTVYKAVDRYKKENNITEDIVPNIIFKIKKETIFNITSDMILEKVIELKSCTKVAEFFKCSPSLISTLSRKYGIEKEFRKYICRYDDLDEMAIIEEFNKTGNKSSVAKKFGTSRDVVRNIINKHI
jgi:hypothetical protein